MRPAIIKLHEKSFSVRKIASLLDVPRSTVQDHLKRYEQTSSHQNKPKGRPQKTARNRRNIQRCKGMIRRNPTTKSNSTRKLAKKLGISQTSVLQILRKDLRMKPYKFLKRQKLSEKVKNMRFQRARALLQRFSQGRHHNIVFSDEKLFNIEQVVNTQNDRI